MRKRNLRARICKCTGNETAQLKTFAELFDKQKLQTEYMRSLSCAQHEQSILTETYKTLKGFLKNAIPGIGCYRVEIYKNPLATYEGTESIAIIMNGKIIEEFHND